ncbi:hypothetical protein Tco_0784765 [Tanacetum coccineum]
MVWMMEIVIMKWKRFLLKQQVLWHLRMVVGVGRKSLYKRWKYDYDDNPYDDDDYEDLTEEQLVVCDAFDIKICGHTRRS